MHFLCPALFFYLDRQTKREVEAVEAGKVDTQNPAEAEAKAKEVEKVETVESAQSNAAPIKTNSEN